MELTTIKENNKLIANFLGWREQTDPTEKFFGEWFDTKGVRRTFKNSEVLLFHSDWNWLMVAIKKIDSYANEEMSIDEFDTYRNAWVMIDKPSKFDIGYVFIQVGEFIDYYNKNLK